MFSEWAVKRIESIGPERIVVALSGGVDSVTLLHLAVAQFGSSRVSAVHVHHGLAPAADDWQACCTQALPIAGRRTRRTSGQCRSDRQSEANARRARYEVFESVLGADDVVLLAHHSDDQVETILQNLLRGSDRFGVTGMPAERRLGDGVLIRPLLAASRAEIRQWAASHDLEWMEDPANTDESFTRNFLRHTLLPAVETRWPSAGRALLEASRRDGDYRQVIDFAGEIDTRAVLDGPGMRIEGLSRLPIPRRLNVIRYRLERLGLPQPGRDALVRGLEDLLGARSDGAPLVTWQGVSMRRYQGRVFIVAETGGNVPVSTIDVPSSGVVDFGGGRLAVESVLGRGIRQRNDYVALRRAADMEIRLRHRRPIKKLLAEMGVPPWLRDRIPIICDGDVVVGVPGLPDWQVTPVIADGYVPESGEPAVEMTFRMPGQPYSH
ncbi:MAG: tRNA lysidine(34) synthetase TilS [Gammaproteobacteria bacterium]|nr:tRNA lysidine(34) synthetase TilS [Gammaproteobacteria bacterium]